MSSQIPAWDFLDAVNFAPKLTLDHPGSLLEDLSQPPPFPTPPQSTGGSPYLDVVAPSSDEGTALSTMFFPGAAHFQVPPDLALLSLDSVYFYVNSSHLLEHSSNYFGSLLARAPEKYSEGQSPTVNVDLSSPVLNLILHAIYDLSCAQYGPDLDTLCQAVEALPKFGLYPKKYIMPHSTLYTLLLSFAPLKPMVVYSLAAHFELHELAIASSSHMLSFPLATITDDMAIRVGPVYLKRLFFLHLGRMDALKRVVLQAPHPHAPTRECSFVDQKRLTRAWSLASAYLAFDARPDMSAGAIEAVFRPLLDNLTCDLCIATLNERVNQLLVSWSLIKRTI